MGHRRLPVAFCFGLPYAILGRVRWFLEHVAKRCGEMGDGTGAGGASTAALWNIPPVLPGSQEVLKHGVFDRGESRQLHVHLHVMLAARPLL